MASPQPVQALTKRNMDTALMPPPPRPSKRIKRPSKVLDEDVYTGALSHIIARDFFPGLLETQCQQDFLDALESKDTEWINDAGRRLTEVMTPGRDGRRMRGRRGTSMTPVVDRAWETPSGWAGDTPNSVAGSDISGTTPKKGREREDYTNMSLTSFQAKYTSEDNESFNALLDKQNAKRAEKYSWLWNGNKIPSGRQIAHRERESRLLTASESSTDENTTGHGRKLTLLRKDQDARKAMPDIRPSASRNAFMFLPDSIEDTHETVAEAAAAASNAPPKAVIYDNTRLPPPPVETDADSIPPSPSLSAIDAAIAGRPRPTDSEPGYAGAETPRVNGYAFVDEEPTPSERAARDGAAHQPESADAAALLARLGSGADSSPNPFRIKDSSRREALHHALVERALQKKRLHTDGGVATASTPIGRTPTPRFASGPDVRRGNLTPAAQRLLDKVGMTPKGGGKTMGDAFGVKAGTPLRKESGLRKKWATPTPKAKLSDSAK